jgi:hypothetical protein
MRKLLLALVALALGACAEFNPFNPSPEKWECVSWASLHPADTTHSSTFAVAHQDSVCARRR